MAAAVNKKISVQSLLGTTLVHNGITIGAGEVVMIDEALAKDILEKGYIKVLKVKEL